jgi:myo-inositol 2-dehydrogenase / D-chiro-inositol 1-dehydrogenase
MSAKVRICLVGVGRAGRVHANSIVNHVPQAELVAMVDENRETLQKVGAGYAINAQFSSLSEALAKVDFDAVVITTPTFTHAPLALLAAQNSKNVFCEKPMALALADCDAMISAAEEHHVALQIGFMRRFDPEFEAAASRIEAGEIGRPMIIKSLTHGPGLPPPWARDLKTSSGLLAEVNSHDWDAIRWLAGSNLQRVYAEVANFKGPRLSVESPNFYDNAIVNIRFESGALGSISGVCPCEYGYDARAEIVGERGILQIGELRGQAVTLCTDREQGLRSPVFRTWPERFAWGYIREMQHFVESICSGSKPRVAGEDGRWALAGVLAATKSFIEQRPVELHEILQASKTKVGEA